MEMSLQPVSLFSEFKSFIPAADSISRSMKGNWRWKSADQHLAPCKLFVPSRLITHSTSLLLIMCPVIALRFLISHSETDFPPFHSPKL